MKFFLDENFPKAASGMLEGMGHEVFDLRGTDREGSQDGDIFAEDWHCRLLPNSVFIGKHDK